jgi:hypothetical protein
MSDASPGMPRDDVTPEHGAVPKPDEPRARPTRSPRAGRADDSAAMVVGLAQDRNRIAKGMTSGIVVHRLFFAGLYLEAVLELMGDHPGAKEVREAIGELDRAIVDIRNVVFDQPDWSPGGQPG